jgi:hypothetical protein
MTMGMFDDLIPAASGGGTSGGMFDDLIPSKTPLADKAPEDVSAGMALRGIPVLGAYIPQVEAAIQAAAHSLTGVGAPGETYAERYAANLPMREQQYQRAEREHPIASGLLQAGGGTVALAPLGATALGARALGLTGSIPTRLAAGAASGAGLSAADVAARGGSVDDAISAAKFGGAVGAVAPVVAAGVGKAISPFLARDPVRAARVATLEAEGYKPTAGEATGSRPLQWMEQHFGELGGVSKTPQAEQLGAAAFAKAGQAETRATPEAMDRAFGNVGKQFDELAQQTAIPKDRALLADVGTTIKEFDQRVSATNRPAIVRAMQKEINNAYYLNKQSIPGDVYKELTSKLEAEARAQAASGPTGHAAADALRNMRGALDNAMERGLQQSNSPLLGAWKDARGKYRNLLVLEKVAVNPNTQNGLVTPAGLYAATKQVQGIRNMARGRGDLQPLAQAASDVLRNLPSSGTAQRMYYQGIPGLIGGVGGALYSGGDPTSAAGFGLLGLAGPPLAGRALMSPRVQRYLANQAMAGPAGQLTRAATVGALRNIPPPSPQQPY